MAEKTVEDYVEEAMNPETFNVLDYIDEQPVAEDTITVYVDIVKARTLHKLVNEREQELARRREAAKTGQTVSLSLTDEDDDTEYDEEINELVADLEKTALHFEIQTVAPSLRKAIEKKYIATEPKDNEVALQEHRRKGTADVLGRAIKSVTLADGRKDESPWPAERVLGLEDRLYEGQAQRLIGALYDMVNTGYVFDEALNADF